MKAILLVLLSVVIAALAAEEDVFVLTDANFDDWIAKQDLALVEFYAPWCGHCKKLAPEFATAAEQLKKNDPPIALAKLDATVETKVAGRFDIKGYPTLKIFRKGTEAEYKGPRDGKGIIAYMAKQSGPSAKPLSTVDEVKNFLKKDRDVAVIGFFPSKSSAATDFLKTADQLREDFRFGYVSDASVLSKFEGVSEGTTLFRGEEKIPFTGGNLASWVWDVSVPKVGEVTKDNFKRYQKKGLPVLKVYADVDGAKQATYFLNRLKKVAEDAGIKDKLNFAIANSKDFKDEIEKFGVSGNSASVVIDDFANNLKYKFTGGFSVDKVTEFANDWVAKKIKPYIKSEAVPTPNDEPVKVVVGETWNDIVMNTNQDVLIELYAPWCGHCKKLVPIYDELAKGLSGVSNLVIAKMDATANDIPHGKYQAKGYPTILFAKANDKENPIAYSGAREVKDFTEFLKKNTHAAKWDQKTEL